MSAFFAVDIADATVEGLYILSSSPMSFIMVLMSDFESAVSYIVKLGLKPMRSACMRNMRRNMEWNVPIHSFEAVA